MLLMMLLPLWYRDIWTCQRDVGSYFHADKMPSNARVEVKRIDIVVLRHRECVAVWKYHAFSTLMPCIALLKYLQRQIHMRQPCASK